MYIEVSWFPPGQFYHGVEFQVVNLRPGVLQENLAATMYVRGQTLNVTRYMCVTKFENMHTVHAR